MNKRYTLLFSILILSTSIGFCEIRLPKLISDGAILQRDTKLEIWGWASPFELVEVDFRELIFKTQANEEGKWLVELPPQKAGGPYTMIFKATNEIRITNILFGDVWLCSGQSNMELTMDRLRDTYPEIIMNSENPNIRQFLVADKYDFNIEHSDYESGCWKEANPQNLLEFSGVAYFFANDLYEKYNVPVGIINAALGGSPIESWMSEEALKPFPEAYNELQRFKNMEYINEIEREDRERQESWYKELNKKDLGYKEDSQWYLDNIDEGSWEEMEVPGFWVNQGLGNMNGVVWFRKKILIPENMIGKQANLWLGRIVDQDHVYVNGEFVGSTGYQYPPRKYIINENILRSGENTITIRVINEQGQGGFIQNKPYFLSAGKDSIDLKGKWRCKPGISMKPLEGPTFVRWKPAGLYNKMISPLVDYKIKGVIWYQGESNTHNPDQYSRTLPALIKNWRDKWQIGEFPFIFVQLPNFMEESNEPMESNWAALRQAQLKTLSVPNTGMVVAIDLGEWNDIHPLNKQDVGKRLAQQAFHLAYGDKDMILSPIPQKNKFYKKKVEIWFNNAEKGLISKDGEALKFFEISADGNKFFKAKAAIKNDKVMVWNEKIKDPVSVRYAWANNPIAANLYSGAGLPASPFEIKKNKNRKK